MITAISGTRDKGRNARRWNRWDVGGLVPLCLEAMEDAESGKIESSGRVKKEGASSFSDALHREWDEFIR